METTLVCFVSCHRKYVDVGQGCCTSSQSVATVTQRKQHLDPADEHHLRQLCPIRHQGAIKKKYSDPAQVKLTAFKLLCEIFKRNKITGSSLCFYTILLLLLGFLTLEPVYVV